MNRFTIKYEFLNTLYNGYAFFFGAIFPVLLLHLVGKGYLSDVPTAYISKAYTTLFIGFAMLTPLASVFLSHAASYANELDKNIPERIILFGFSQKKILLNKMMASFIFLTFCFAIYLVGTVPFLDIAKPALAAVVVWIISFYILSAFLLMLSHGIATLIQKFGPTYGVVMGLYFAIMILSGYMGVPTSKFPKGLQAVSDWLPTKQLGNDYINYWMGKEYNLGPLIQSMIFFGALSLLVLLIAFKVRGRKSS